MLPDKLAFAVQILKKVNLKEDARITVISLIIKIQFTASERFLMAPPVVSKNNSKEGIAHYQLWAMLCLI